MAIERFANKQKIASSRVDRKCELLNLTVTIYKTLNISPQFITYLVSGPQGRPGISGDKVCASGPAGPKYWLYES